MPSARTGFVVPVRFPTAALVWAGAAAMACACVPAGNAPPYDAGPSTALLPVAVAPTAKRPAIASPPLTTVFEDNFDRAPRAPAAGAVDAAVAAPIANALTLDAALDAKDMKDTKIARANATDAALVRLEADAGASVSLVSGEAGARTGDTGDLGPDWLVAGGNVGGAWRIDQGRLCGRNAKNRGVWLNRTLPVNARIEFDATSDSPEGDIKAEVWGDGLTGATGVSYTNATSYLVVFGGWKNTLHVIARLNEHGTDRKEIQVKPSTDEFRERAVAHGQTYRFKIERSDGKTVRWWVNDVDMMFFDDPAPLTGATHDHVGFNNWQVRVCYDNVKVTPLSPM